MDPFEARLQAAMREHDREAPATAEILQAVRTSTTRSTSTAAATWGARHRQLSVATVMLAVVLLIAGVVALASQRADQAPSTAGTPTPHGQTPDSGVSAEDWAPKPTTRGKPARTGTFAYWSCAGAGCAVTLVRPDGRSFALADMLPGLAERLDTTGLSGVSLSYDAQWLGYQTSDGGYAVYSPAGGTVAARLEPGPPGSRWRMIGWGEGSHSLGLAQWTDGRVTAYASIEDLQVHVYDAPDTLERVPVASGGYLVELAAPLDLSVPVTQRPRVTVLETESLSVSRDFENPGSISPSEPRDLSPCMAPQETLAGPHGVPVLTTPPPSRSDYSSAKGVGVTTVFTVEQGQLVPSAMIRGSTCPAGVARELGFSRYELPRSSATQTWTYLGPVAGGDTAMTRQPSGGSSKDVVVVGPGGAEQIVGQVPADAQVLVPGTTVP